ncbi:efflux RND transporter periplasmic adaptor subunit [Cochlodiniinecator piscidefendens]|uniref:efflux RND transporter periplasmic adaptor subunit n=1 Tax=Cochlodiniinecator piscidefendens TaxID=2715756 RepID=UPI00140E91E5|nr:HlyD family efflux transporter periplasmic adaptor subunit [Cochlodiniinecator piscidefendens]
MRFLGRSLTGVFLLSLTVGFLALGVSLLLNAIEAQRSGGGFERAAQERVFAVNALDVEVQDIAPELRVFGEVTSQRTLDVRATSSGRVVFLAPQFVEGGRVQQGTVLLRIDPAEARSALSRAEADLLEAQAEVQDAARALSLAQDERAAAEAQARLRLQAVDRQRDLRTRGVGTEAAVETAELAASQADQAVLSRRQAIAQAEARTDLAQTRLIRQEISLADAQRALDETEIRAEFSGVLANVVVVQGGLVANNERLAQLSDPLQLEVRFRVSAAQYARLLMDGGGLISSPVTVSLDVGGSDLNAQGVISRESASVGEGQTGRLLFAGLSNARGLRPGDFVSVHVVEPVLAGVVLVPSAAVSADGTVLAINEEDRLEAIPMTLLRRQGDDVIIGADGLDGRRIVREVSPILGAGIKVRMIEAEPALDVGSIADVPNTQNGG